MTQHLFRLRTSRPFLCLQSFVSALMKSPTALSSLEPVKACPARVQTALGFLFDVYSMLSILFFCPIVVAPNRY